MLTEQSHSRSQTNSWLMGFNHFLHTDLLYQCCSQRTSLGECISTLGANGRDRTGSVPAWKAGAPPLMRHLLLLQYVKDLTVDNVGIEPNHSACKADGLPSASCP